MDMPHERGKKARTSGAQPVLEAFCLQSSFDFPLSQSQLVDFFWGRAPASQKPRRRMAFMGLFLSFRASHPFYGIHPSTSILAWPKPLTFHHCIHGYHRQQPALSGNCRSRRARLHFLPRPPQPIPKIDRLRHTASLSCSSSSHSCLSALSAISLSLSLPPHTSDPDPSLTYFGVRQCQLYLHVPLPCNGPPQIPFPFPKSIAL